ncbi:MAG: aspartate aminotransferase family protein [Chloroflexi bacterium]|nr:aspartate aminotransferase family protein [Chloroflexota bacterium]
MSPELNALEELYRSRTAGSLKLSNTAGKYLPGGVAANGKYLPPYPIYMIGGQGAEMIDVDRNKYIDLLMGAGVHILGHSPERVLRAVHQQLDIGVHYYLPAEAEVKLAEKVCQVMPSVEMVRFLNSGSESTLMAIRAARAYRKRSKIVKFEGNFHGQHDTVLVSTLAVEGEPNSPIAHIDSAGIPENVKENVIILPYNDPEIAGEQIRKHADELGGVIVEPVSAFGLGVVPAEIEFLKALSAVTTETGIPLIFDEVVTNFRLALGGAAEYFKIVPDLVCLGKILGGGFAIGGFGGKREIMDRVVTPKVGLWDLSEQIFQSGCFSGNPVSMVAGLAVLEELEKGTAYPQINSLAESLCSGMTALGERLGVPLLATRVASIFQFHFTTSPIKNKRDALKANKQAAGLFHLGLRAHGIMASAHPLFISTAHNQGHVGRVLEISETVLKQMLKDKLF